MQGTIFKHITCLIIFCPHHNTVRWGLLLSPHFTGEQSQVKLREVTGPKSYVN